MSKKKKEQQSEVEQSVGEVLSSTEQFIENNQKSILFGVSVIVLIVLGILLFRNFYQKPREIKAENAMYQSQSFFAVDSFRLALKGNAEIIGFEQIASDYGMTRSGNLANAYAGICEYKLGNYERAVKFLSKYDAEDNYFKTTIVGLIGDCYAELNNLKEAQSYYKKAINTENIMSPIYLKKSGILYEVSGDKEKALERFQTIKEDYPQSSEAYDIDKYIARVQK